MTGAGQDDALDRRLMRRALRAARKGRPSPNPHVGAVVARGATVVAVGHHARAGEAHAEVAALQQAAEGARGATLYVTFEPCNHHGRTGPCTEAIIAAGVTRVVIGCRDPAPHVPGALERLEAAGIDVRTGVCEAEATDLIRDFAKHITTGMPYVTLKAAVTLDGKMATRTGDSRWITGERARRHAHRMRAESDAVLVGAGTVAADDPQLTVRHVRGPSPLRIVVDPSLRTPAGAMVLEPTRGDAPSPGPSVLFHAARARADRRDALAARATLIEVPEAEGGLDLTAVLRELGRRDVVRLLVEGGPTLHGALLDAGLVDRLAVFVAPRIIGDAEAPSLARGRGVERVRDALAIERLRTRRLGHDVLFEGPVARWKPAEG